MNTLRIYLECTSMAMDSAEMHPDKRTKEDHDRFKTCIQSVGGWGNSDSNTDNCKLYIELLIVQINMANKRTITCHSLYQHSQLFYLILSARMFLYSRLEMHPNIFNRSNNRFIWIFILYVCYHFLDSV
jgi:hypothetical protein